MIQAMFLWFVCIEITRLKSLVLLLS